MNEFLQSILNWINGIIGNYGWSIIVFTLLIKLILLPFDYKSRVSMRKTALLQPKLAELQKKYADDKEKLQRKSAELYKKEKINPLSSCLPMLLTFPILFAMFAAMRMVANEGLAGQVFSILSGTEPQLEKWLWIKNIWMPDSFFASSWPEMSLMQQIPYAEWQAAFRALGEGASLLPAELGLTLESFSQEALGTTVSAINAYLTALPAYAEQMKVSMNIPMLITNLTVVANNNGMVILPILSGVSQYLATILQPASAGGTEQQNANGKFMKFFFPVFSFFICFSSNAAFALYWVASNVIAIAQSYFINMYLDHKENTTNTVVSAEGDIK